MIPWKRWILSQLHLSTRTPTTSTKRTFYPPTWSNITIVYNYPCSFGFHHTLSVWLIVVLCLNNRVSHVMVWSWSYSIRSCKGGWTKVVIITQGSPEDLSGFLVLHRLCHITLEYCYNVTMCYNVYIVILLLQPSPCELLPLCNWSWMNGRLTHRPGRSHGECRSQSHGFYAIKPQSQTLFKIMLLLTSKNIYFCIWYFLHWLCRPAYL